MRTSKQELISDDLKPFICQIIKEARQKYNYSFEDLSKALGGTKNRQTLHKYETGSLNIPYDVFFEICNIFNVDMKEFESIPMSKKEKELLDKKMIKECVKTLRKDKNLTSHKEKIINTYKNASYEPINSTSELSIKLLDDSMSPVYNKGDKIYFNHQDDYKNGDDIVIAIKNGILAVRRLYRYPKGIILQAINPKHQTINVNIISNEMILGKVVAVYREIK